MTSGKYTRTEEHKKILRENSPFKEGNKNIAKRQDIREILSEKTKEQMRLHPNKGMLGKYHSLEVKEIIRNKSYKQFENGMPQETRNKISNKLKGRKLSEEIIEKYRNKIFSKEHRENLSKSRIGMKFSEEHKERLKESRRLRKIPLIDTSIELKIQKFLSLLHLEYLTHKYINITHGYQCDILIPSINTIIECDGCFWHDCPVCGLNGTIWTKERKELDEVRTKELQDKGFKVIRLWEHQIKPMRINEFKEIVL
jgi:DNA mismatch endonuclease (patch repair protein)